MPTIPRDPTEDAETDAQIFLECADRLRIAEQAEGTNRVNAIDDLEFADGQQWPDDLYNARTQRNQVTLTLNHTATLMRRIKNNMRQQRPRIKVHPVSDGVDVEDARVASGLIRHVETLSKASVAYDTAGESAVNIGWGYFRIVGDYADEKSFDQELFFKPVRNTFTGYIDPASVMPDGSDMEWFIFAKNMKKEEYKRLYSSRELNEWLHASAGDYKGWDNKESIRLAEYYRMKHVPDTLYELSTGAILYKSEFDKATFDLAGVTITRQRPTARRQVQWFLINGTTVIERRDLPGRWIPVIRVEGNVLDLNGDVRRKGAIRDIKEPARMVNYWESAKTAKLALSSKAPWVMAEGQSDGHPEWDDANQKPYSKLVYKIILDRSGQLLQIPPPQRQPAAEVEAGFAEAMQSAMQHLTAIAGMPHEPSQDMPGQVISGKALRQRQALSDISHFQYYDNQTMAIAHGGRILLDLFPYYYSEERMQRIIGEDGMPSMVAINKPSQNPSTGITEIKNNLSVGKYDVVMDTGPGYDTKRQEGAEALTDLLRVQPVAEIVAKSGADLLFRAIDAPYMDQLADRVMPMNPQGMDQVMKELPEQAQNIIKSIQAQNQQLQQQLQHAQLEIKYKMGIEQSWQQTELQKTQMQTTVKAHDVDKRDATAERDTQVKAHTQLLVAEIGAAGQLLNTNTEAAHDRAAAKEMVKNAETAEKSNGAA